MNLQSLALPVVVISLLGALAALVYAWRRGPIPFGPEQGVYRRYTSGQIVTLHTNVWAWSRTRGRYWEQRFDAKATVADATAAGLILFVQETHLLVPWEHATGGEEITYLVPCPAEEARQH